jgi:thiol-disulfide isomerase/thioredoxin
MNVKLLLRISAVTALSLVALVMPVAAQSIEGLWDATVTLNGTSIPFKIELSGEGANVKSDFFNGNEKVNPSTSGSFQDGALVLRFASYATELKATLNKGSLIGTYGGTNGDSYSFQAKRHVESPTPVAGVKVPHIEGVWEIQVKSPKGESAWSFVVNQRGPQIAAAIVRVDGDTGTLAGNYQDGKFVLSHFTGERPLYLEVTPALDGSLQLEIVSFRTKQMLTALRPDMARAKGLSPPDDPMTHTKMKNPAEPLHFSFPDLSGQLVSDTDKRFQGKVLLVNIGGSWCPNCHDEAPFLEELYRKYHSQGLEIVALDFEGEDQLKDLSRLRAFIKRYGIEYTYLVAGEPSQLNEKLPQAENLNAWPTTFFVGRDGLVRSIHTGFTSRASGQIDSRLKDEMTNEVARLLSENGRAASGGTK